MSHLPGQIMVRTTSGNLVEVQVSELSDALSREVSALKAELMSIRDEKEKELRSVRKYHQNQKTTTDHVFEHCYCLRNSVKVVTPEHFNHSD